MDPLDGMSDKDVAKLTRKVAKIMAGQFGPDGKREEVGYAAGAASMLIALVVDANSVRLQLKMSDFIRHGESAGDWTVTVQKDGAELASTGPAEDVTDPASLQDGRVITSLEYIQDLETGEVSNMKRKGPLN